jgi:plasmid stabilization system protein ParE
VPHSNGIMPLKNIVWSPLAVDRASEIAGYIAQDKPSAAEKWIKTVFSKVEQLKEIMA